jgi:CRISPR/Cas system-associated endonuclease/helicase Cas3
VKTEARKLKERIKKKQKKRQLRNKKRIQYNRENNITFGYESPPEYTLDETTNEDTYYSSKQEAAENYKNKVIRKTDMTAKEFYRELEEKGDKTSETESESQ